MTSEAEIWSPTPEDPGIDAAMQRRIAEIVLDPSIELPGSGRTAQGNFRPWEHEPTVAYGKWLFAVLSIENPELQTLSVSMITRASKLNLGPSVSVLYSDPLIRSLTRYQELIGTIPEKPFLNWTRSECIARGLELTELHGRLSRKKLNELSKDGIFPGDVAIRARFGTLRHFHELTGKPSVRGWDYDDYIQWGVAFMKQNPDRKLDRDAVLELAARQVGPSDRAITKTVGGIRLFRSVVKEEYEREALHASERRQRSFDEIKEGLESGDIPGNLFGEDLDDEKLRIFGLFRLTKSLLPDLPASKLVKISRMKNPDDAVRRIAEEDHGLGIGEIEIEAEDLDVFDDIWPMERFQNVDLKLAA